MTEPYYSDEWVTLYCGDSRDILPQIQADVLVADPPYGVDLGNGSSQGTHGSCRKAINRGRKDPGRGLLRVAYDEYEDTYDNFVDIVVPVIRQALGQVKRGAVFSGPHLQELPKAAALGGVYSPAASGRHSWGFKTFLPVMFYGTSPGLAQGKGAAKPTVLQSTAQAVSNGHPCPKPLPWMRWLVDLTTMPGETVLDPFAGSGTTLRAAKDLGLRAIGIELDERYCEIAVRELAQDVLPLAFA